MKWTEIVAFPTSVTQVPLGCTGVHESCLRAYQILAKTRDYLERGVPADVLLELIDEFSQAPPGGD